MGRYKSDNIIYNNREQRTEVLIADGYHNAQRKPTETIEIAAHLMAEAYKDGDDDLMEVARDLMRMAGSPCQFKGEESSDKSIDSNNRRPEPIAPVIPAVLWYYKEDIDEVWDSSRDEIFNKKINPQAVKKAIDCVESEKIKDRPYFYVAFVILKILKYIPTNTSPRDFLLWVNLHFSCGWSERPEKKHQLIFRLEGILKKLSKKHPSEWKDADDDGEKFWGNLNIDYYKLAISFKNVFTYTIVNEKQVGVSESFEHLRDRVEILKGARDIYGTLLAPEEAYVNNGK